MVVRPADLIKRFSMIGLGNAIMAIVEAAIDDLDYYTRPTTDSAGSKNAAWNMN